MAGKTSGYKFNGQTSKADEFQALSDFAAQFDPDNTYIGSLLNATLLRDVQQAIADDFSCDLYGDAKATAEQLHSRAIKAEQTAADLGKQVTDLNAALERRKGELEVAITGTNNAWEQVRKAQDAVDEYRTRLNDTEDKLDAEIERLNGEILTLKARLFDALDAAGRIK